MWDRVRRTLCGLVVCGGRDGFGGRYADSTDVVEEGSNESESDERERHRAANRLSRSCSVV